MRKKLSILLVLVMVLTLAIPVLVACDGDDAKVTAIKVVDPVKEYEVNATIDYDNLKIKVTYSDGKEETKTLKELGATHTNADLSKVGNASYTVTYKGKTDTVSLTVKAGGPSDVKLPLTNFVAPEFYNEYKTKSAERSQAETRSDFRVTGEVYEVGNVNKFIFQPTATYLDITSGNADPVTLQDVKTTAKVSVKDSNDTYVEVKGDELAQIVAIENNTYKFTEDAAGKYVKLDVSIDETQYNVDGLEDENKVISVELLVVDGGYNVYDQIGLSVMNDLYKKVWAPIWGCTVDADFNLVPGNDPIKLVADEQPLYTYVGNIKCVVMHTSLVLDADTMPADFFWTKESEYYNDMLTILNNGGEAVAKLAELLDGSLRDGVNDDVDFKLMDLKDNVSPSLDISVNMVKGLYGTGKVSVSGNYNSVVVPTEKSALGRHFYSVMDDDINNALTTPSMHWDVFQILQSHKDGAVNNFYIKNIAATGVNSQEDNSPSVPAGPGFLNCYSSDFVVSNVLVNSFYSTINCDSYGATSFAINNSKLYDAFSNMFFGWRAQVTVTNSELIGSGGPLFVMSDGDRQLAYNKDNIMAADDEVTKGCVFTVDSKSKLQAYAQGSESWYKLNNAQLLFQVLSGDIETRVLNNLGKTILFDHPDDTTKKGYVNVIAVFISEVGSIFSGHTESSNSYMPEVHGMFTTTADSGAVANQFKMHNLATNAVKLEQFNAGLTSFNATLFPPVIQIGNKFGMVRPEPETGADSFMDVETGKFLTKDPSFVPSWMATTNDKMAVYLSAGPLSKVDIAPYIGVILDVANYTKPAA